MFCSLDPFTHIYLALCCYTVNYFVTKRPFIRTEISWLEKRELCRPDPWIYNVSVKGFTSVQFYRETAFPYNLSLHYCWSINLKLHSCLVNLRFKYDKVKKKNHC